ncbi:hypothetical protein MYX77_05800 [Acidobacteriia bacterium AH_259_A11_L15]|nr:hypothetical protein [Acidobacteriia bacterium AH_259_A11_L15]
MTTTGNRALQSWAWTVSCSDVMSVLKLLPEFHARPWGRRDLSPLYEPPRETPDPIGEVWLTSLSCRLLAADARETLGERWARMAPEKRGRAAAGP